jgi:hypothetical protein
MDYEIRIKALDAAIQVVGCVHDVDIAMEAAKRFAAWLIGGDDKPANEKTAQNVNG